MMLFTLRATRAKACDSNRSFLKNVKKGKVVRQRTIHVGLLLLIYGASACTGGLEGFLITIPRNFLDLNNRPKVLVWLLIMFKLWKLRKAKLHGAAAGNP
ncbi:hypothetical protein NC651_023368 [Populus alba x Populus x berolinensis]|nr:hypothetical protein NC651_023368 [Populus alba x Populus x berolinensis]